MEKLNLETYEKEIICKSCISLILHHNKTNQRHRRMRRGAGGVPHPPPPPRDFSRANIRTKIANFQTDTIGDRKEGYAGTPLSNCGEGGGGGGGAPRVFHDPLYIDLKN